MTVYIMMGVSGCGKTTVGEALAEVLGCPFYDGDGFHPAANIAKMSQGMALNDADRIPWLDRLHDLVSEHITVGTTAVLACSALKKAYRDHLRGTHEAVQFVYLAGNFDLIGQRMQTREGHYMKTDMLKSQFETLEQPNEQEALTLSIAMPPTDIVAQIRKQPPL